MNLDSTIDSLRAHFASQRGKLQVQWASETFISMQVKYPFFYRRIFVQFYVRDRRVSFYLVILFTQRRYFSRFAISEEKIINNVIFGLKEFINAVIDNVKRLSGED